MFILSWKCSQQCKNVSYLSSVNRRGYVFNLVLSSMLAYCFLWNLKSQSLSWVLEITTSWLLFEFIWCCSCSAFSELCLSQPGASLLRTSPSSFNCLLFCFSQAAFLLSFIFGELLFNIIFLYSVNFHTWIKYETQKYPCSFPPQISPNVSPNGWALPTWCFLFLFLFYTLWYRCD